MFIITFAHIAILFVELVTTSTNTNRTLIPGFEDTFTYCDPEFYTVNIMASYEYADNKCASKCSSLRGYINSQNELVCYYNEKLEARRISRIDLVSKGECLCGSKDEKKDNRQACYPPFTLEYEDCDSQCGKYTLLRGKKFNESILNIMWCGKEWIENNIIKKLDSIVKEVGQVEKNLTQKTIYSCFCGSKSIKANTFLSKDTSKKMEQRKISRNNDGRDLDRFVATCSFGKFWIKTYFKYKCQSICTTKKAFILLDRRELICYSDIQPSSGFINQLEENSCTCGAVMRGKYVKARNQECIPAIRKERAKDVDEETFIDDCELMCQNQKAYIESNTEIVELVFCESSINPSPKISVDLRLQYKLGEISKDGQLIECECGLTELSLIKIENENRYEIARSSHITNKKAITNNTANSSKRIRRASTLRGILNGSRSTENIEKSPIRMSLGTSLSPEMNRDGNTRQIDSSSQASSLNHIANSHPTCNRDGITTHIRTSSQLDHQIGMGNRLATSPQTEHQVGMGNRIATSSQTEHQIGIGNRIATSATEAVRSSTGSSQKGSRIQIESSPPKKNSGGKTRQVASFSQLITHGGKQNQVTNLPQAANTNVRSSQKESLKLIQNSFPTLNRDGMQRHIVTSPQTGRQIGMGNFLQTSPQVENGTIRSFQKASRIQITSSPQMVNSGGITNQITSFSQSSINAGKQNHFTNLPQVGAINVRSTQKESLNRTANSHPTVSRVGITSHNSTSSQAEDRLGFANPISSSHQAGTCGITQKEISTNRLDPSRNGKPVTFNRWSSSCNVKNPINNLNQIANSSQIYNRNEGGNLSTGSSHKKINHGAGSSSELNDSDNYTFGEILKNASFVDKLRYDYENELFQIPSHKNQVMPVGFDIIPSKYSQREIKANSESSQAPSASMRDTASSKNKNRDEDEIFGEMLDDVPFLNLLAGYQHPVTIDALRSFSPVRDDFPPFTNCNHKRMLDDSALEATFSLPDFINFPTSDNIIIPVNYESEICSSSFLNHTTLSHGKRTKN